VFIQGQTRDDERGGTKRMKEGKRGEEVQRQRKKEGSR
jgi:hypothetical protein